LPKYPGLLPVLTIRRKPGNPRQGILSCKAGTFACALGRGGTSAFKREGDGATPVGRMRLLHGYFRNDRTDKGRTQLPLAAISGNDGWCDAPADANYNRPVRLPYRNSHERMRRDDGLYDTVIVLEWNVRPRRRNAGSAIFFHLARPGHLPTEGCVAVAPHAMRRLLPFLAKTTVLVVHR
jgi:L,D-peptidoglycan transpeptidase YkuD (ErfK/YbiS/YcfS/YnhG family)